MIRNYESLTFRAFAPALMLLVLVVAACGKQTPSAFNFTALPIPAEKFAPYGLEPGANCGEILLRANTMTPDGSSGYPQLAVAFELADGEGGFAVKQFASLVLERDTFPQCLLPEGKIVKSEGLTTKTPKLWAYSREGKLDITPENLLDVVNRKHLPGVGVRFSDSLQNLYVVLRKKGMGDGPDELWIGREELKQVKVIPDVICEATVLRDGKLHYAVMSSDMNLHILNPETLAFEEDPACAWFTSALQSDKSLDGEKLGHPVVTELIGAVSLKEEIRIYSEDGHNESIRKFSTVDELPSGLPRSRAASQQIIDNQLYLRKEGESLPSDVASTKTRPVLVSDKAIALVDTHYCRIVFVEVAARKTNQS